jgi:hypothetical protein
MTNALHIQPDDVPLLHKTHFNMTNQTPDEDQIERIERIRETFKRLSSLVYVNCPRSRERSLALTGLEESLMWAVASIAREKWDAETQGETDVATS